MIHQIGIYGWGGPSYYYNLKDKIVYRGMSYYLSPDRQYGYTIVNSPDKGNWQGYSLLVKETSTGEIRELIRSNSRWEGLYWLDSKRLIMCKYNSTAKQNELLLLDAAAGSVKHIAYGSLKGFDPAHREVLFVYNEPARTPYIMETATGKIRKAVEQELKRFERQYTSYGERVPTNLDASVLEEWNPQIVIRYEHELQVGDTKVPLPFTVKRGGTLYIPVQPLLGGLGLQLGEKRGTAAKYNFPLLSKDGLARTELTPNNSIVLAGRLFTTSGVLQSLGYPNVRVVAAQTKQISPA
ncbi:hypothetical protein Back11_14330 [Paenibacillus baekrokdamisoli]|uniref:Uncharacterized protein n=1 Tax=Paenibacillus baekrokdamisoli TaxID=1712516 RepID=A0A3G9J8C9_9BACL|nr:hypothetical protein [Paenibacillus baekrokdamisoli]MBB3070739.1 hypothetical protein [Paenibacillus baekrokdamisoli]BBH20088.1 hypothetical protein Back11_14330 [Paenibacillus baekrokdamisoli]